ncbi:hypothetical protein ACLGGT_15740 [Roseovarius sp. MS2]|uniref:hypothetical protein n=1 Tax=Roseovarius sp. MS2 TaxID=3390728 RepID=UPI003EDC0D18
MDDRDNRPRNQVPILADRKGNNRLDVKHQSRSIAIWSDAIVLIELERHTDQRGDRICQLLGKLFGVLGQGLPAPWASKQEAEAHSDKMSAHGSSPY